MKKEVNLWEVCKSGTISVEGQKTFSGSIAEVKTTLLKMLNGAYWLYEHTTKKKGSLLEINLVKGSCNIKKYF